LPTQRTERPDVRDFPGGHYSPNVWSCS
jgi:hypothetical protein